MQIVAGIDERFVDDYMWWTNMLTRAFLILLAMMTGLNAAQAAEATRPAQNPLSVSASHNAKANVEIVLATKQQNRLKAASNMRLVQSIAHVADIKTQQDVLEPMPRTFISDRARL
jgi:hypothetical protein